MTNEQKLQHLIQAISIMIPLKETLERVVAEATEAIENLEKKNYDNLNEDIKMLGMLVAICISSFDNEYSKELKKAKDIADVEEKLNSLFKRKR
jgi:chaperonin cofactor prefoldin